MKRAGLRVLLAAPIGLALLLAVGVVASRVGDRARFVTWPVVAFTALAAGVALLGVWIGARHPLWLALGLLPAAVISYVLLAAPFPFVAVALVAMALLTITIRGVACGIAAGTATLMIVSVLLQGPAVECGKSSVSANSGPWWVEQPNQSTASGSATADGLRAGGTVQVGEHQYSYACDDGRLDRFERLSGQSLHAETPPLVASRPH